MPPWALRVLDGGFELSSLLKRECGQRKADLALIPIGAWSVACRMLCQPKALLGVLALVSRVKAGLIALPKQGKEPFRKPFRVLCLPIRTATVLA
jgi:hypothetical protein